VNYILKATAREIYGMSLVIAKGNCIERFLSGKLRQRVALLSTTAKPTHSAYSTSHFTCLQRISPVFCLMMKDLAVVAVG